MIERGSAELAVQRLIDEAEADTPGSPYTYKELSVRAYLAGYAARDERECRWTVLDRSVSRPSDLARVGCNPFADVTATTLSEYNRRMKTCPYCSGRIVEEGER